MMRKSNNLQKSKISPEFTERLLRLSPDQKVRAIVMLHTDVTGETATRRHLRGNRQAVIKAIRKSAEPALVDIDGVLERFDGKRLATNVDALGCIPIEVTADGIRAVAASDHVKAILEDQAISPLPRPKR